MSGSAWSLTIAIPMVGVCFHLSRLIYFINTWMLYSIIARMSLLFICNRTNCLVFFRWTACRIFLWFHQTVQCKNGNNVNEIEPCDLPFGHSVIEALKHWPWILRTKLCVTTVMPASSWEWIVATFELARYLFVCCSPSWHQHHMKTS